MQLALQLPVEQPFKTPFVAAVLLLLNALESGKEVVGEVVDGLAKGLDEAIRQGEWRDVKSLMKLLGGLQGLFEGEGVWVVLQDMLGKAVDLQTENNEEVRLLFSWDGS